MGELQRSNVSLTGPSHPVNAYISRPRDDEKHPGPVLIDEIGQNAHTDARRFASEHELGLIPQSAIHGPAANIIIIGSFIRRGEKLLEVISHSRHAHGRANA